MLDKAVFSRAGIDGLFKEYIGDTPIEDALTSEMLIVAYDFNHNQPRFYSKELARADRAIYDVTISEASASSAAIPGGFPPMQVKTGYNITDLNIDGGVIANNPALYAYLFSAYREDLHKEKANIRILAISCGQKAYNKTGTLKAPEDMQAYTQVTNIFAYMLEINQLTADWYLGMEYDQKKKRREAALGKKDKRFDYLRVDGLSTASSASTSKKNID